jgi:NAD(P)-dependent dehydrogenase (short-subunit alcohol dehydrogenase family)
MDKPVALITGGAGGLGSAIAAHLAQSGARIVATGRSAEPLANLKAALSASTDVATLQQDITAKDAPRQAIEFAASQFGRLDYLINNAGPGYPKPLKETSDELIDTFIDAHLRAPARFAREALDVMESGGSIVNISSCLAIRGRAGVGIYAAAKAGLIGLTRQIAVEFGPKGIRCNAVAPGVMATAMSSNRLSSTFFQRTMLETVPLPISTGEPDDIGAAVAYLCSDKARFINGHVLVVDGGWSETHFLNNDAISR